tara:strand:+ start:253 stop:453 length:201 start_codon:yes stop_codon:yes gene_type:complete
MIQYILTLLTGTGICLMAFSFLSIETAMLLVQNSNALLLLGFLLAALSFIAFVDLFRNKHIRTEDA